MEHLLQTLPVVVVARRPGMVSTLQAKRRLYDRLMSHVFVLLLLRYTVIDVDAASCRLVQRSS